MKPYYYDLHAVDTSSLVITNTGPEAEVTLTGLKQGMSYVATLSLDNKCSECHLYVSLDPKTVKVTYSSLLAMLGRMEDNMSDIYTKVLAVYKEMEQKFNGK